MGWYAVRSIYLFATEASGINTFEERIVCFKASNANEAGLKAAKESKEYAEENNFISHDEQVVYRQDGEKLIDGYELWSELYNSNLSLGAFYEKRYKKFDYILGQ